MTAAKKTAKPKANKPPRRTSPDGDANGFRRTRRDHRRERAEDYVELIAELIEEKGEARAVDMARRLGVSHVTVSRTLTRLKQAGWIRTEPYRSVFLTDAGRELAEKTRERHRIVLDFLIAVGVPRDVATLDAEGIEHHVSPETLKALDGLARRLGARGKRAR